MGLNVSDISRFASLKKEQVALAVRPAAQAGAQVLYDATKRNVKGRHTGRLAAAIYQAFSESNSGHLRASYNISWNKTKAPHGHLVENGYLQRYKVYIGKDGHWYTAVRAEARGKPAPSRKASQAVKDAYYVPLDSPRIVPARSFVRAAVVSSSSAVIQAMSDEFWKRVA